MHRDATVPRVDDCAHFFDRKTGVFYVFGGYLDGVKSNVFFSICLTKRSVTILNENTAPSSPNAANVPPQRAGARLTFVSETNSLYLFGGLTNQNTTLNDMWRFSIDKGAWQQVRQLGRVPSPRCGHSFTAHTDKIFLFGGFKEILRESNDLYKFDTRSDTWEELNEPSVSANSSAK